MMTYQPQYLVVARFLEQQACACDAHIMLRKFQHDVSIEG